MANSIEIWALLQETGCLIPNQLRKSFEGWKQGRRKPWDLTSCRSVKLLSSACWLELHTTETAMKALWSDSSLATKIERKTPARHPLWSSKHKDENPKFVHACCHYILSILFQPLSFLFIKTWRTCHLVRFRLIAQAGTSHVLIQKEK